MLKREGLVTTLLVVSILIVLTSRSAYAQQTYLSIRLACNPLSGQAPFSPSCQWRYAGAIGSVSVVIYWGDGSSSDVTSCISYSCPGHSYSVAGTYTISISITDSSGNTATASQTITVSPATPQTTYNIQVGASGDSASIGSLGVGAEIATNITPLMSQDSSESFWVGDDLQNGAFVQFGYELTTSGNYCLYGEVVGGHTNCLGSSGNIGTGDPRWFWQYWPNAMVTDFYYAFGPANSVSTNAATIRGLGSQAWHLYQIVPNTSNGWSFVLDGTTVWTFNDFQATTSKDPVYVVAEEATTQPSASGTLGPVEFKDLSYYHLILSPSVYEWSQVNSLAAVSGCGVLTINCPSIPYGITFVSSNDILAGTGQTLRTQGELLWSPQVTLTVNAPSEATITVDDQSQILGGQQISLTSGQHTLLASEYVPVSDGVQLRFGQWSDGYASAGRSIDLSSDTTLEAIYVTQYNLTLMSPTPVTGAGWYDQGASANFSCDAMPRITNTLGVAIFQGWYDKNGNLYSTSGTDSVVMNGPLTLHPVWFTLNYFIPIVLVGISAILIILKRRQREDWTDEEEPSEEESAELIQPDRSSYQDSASISEAKTLVTGTCRKKNSVTSTQYIACRHCDAEVPRDRLICPKCGMPASYL